MTYTAEMAHDEAIRAIQEVAPVDWELYFEHSPLPDIKEVAQALERISERAARLAAYLNERAYDGNHHQAVRAQNSMGTKVRRVLGFTYPKQDLNF